ncbi:MAG: hypothetical protein ACK4IA_12595, partial [Paracoccus hibiscisoli]|uniref:hypothetical protein n=1 Tax=Paracoccus hibiscisoli TaxID=2023261 RepID=UPI00391B463D
PLGPRSFLIGEAAFPHIVCSFVMKQTLHQTEGRSGGQVNADGRKPFGAQRMVKLDGQRAGLEHDPPCIRCAPLQNHSNCLRI